MHSSPVTLLWRRATLDRVPESWFIQHVLLAGLGGPIRVLAIDRLEDAPFQSGVIVVSLGTEFAAYLREARNRGMRSLVLLHLGDEQGSGDRTFYDQADLVLRNYWFADVIDDVRVHWVPNGHAIGVGPAGSLIPARDRTTPGFYAGAMGMRVLSDERRAMRDIVEQSGLPIRLHWTPTARDRLGAAAYAAALADARYALVPGGNSPETIRLYDALEMGSIPIMLRSAFVSAPGALDNPPIVLLDDWTQLSSTFADLEAGDANALQARIQEWWRRFKLAQQERIGRLIQPVLEM